MKKYSILFQTKLNEYFAYRTNFILWRVRNVFNLILLYFLWSNVFQSSINIKGYSESMIFTYIFLANILNAFVLSNKLDQVAADILNGNIINQLLKPMNFFSFVNVREVADKSVNILFAVVEVSLFILLLRPPLQVATEPSHYLLLMLFLIIAMVISFSISLALSLLAFWSTEIWAPRFIYMVFISLVAGTLFPLDILPKGLYDLALLTPFPYMVYVPAKMYLFGYTPQVPQLLVVSVIWIILSGLLSAFMWRKGTREFSFFGR